jgi:hypothetical protein
MMQKTLGVLTCLFILVPGVVLVDSADPAKGPLTLYPTTTGNEISNAPSVYPPYTLPAPESTDDIVGDTVTIGTTWYDIQHNGTTGRMIEIDDEGYYHFVWMNGTNNGASDRHIYYNVITPEGTQLWPGTGYAVESSTRAGYTTLDVGYNGIAFPCFHQDFMGTEAFHTAVAADFFPRAGAFITYEPDYLYFSGIDLKIIWPRMRFDVRDNIHVIAQHNPQPDFTSNNGTPGMQYYTIGSYDPLTYAVTFPPDPDTWTEIDWTNTIAYDLDTSPVSDRVAFAWTYSLDEGFPGADPWTFSETFSQWNNDIWVLIDDDGDDFHFEDAFNLTQFFMPDPSWLPDTLMAEMDTLRAYTDMSVFIDQDDWAHIAFTTPSYFHLGQFRYWHASIVWHWSEEFPGEFQIVHNAFDDWSWNYQDCGAWNVKAQRPSLGQDPETGYLYCSYQVYDCDTLAISAAGWPSSDAFVSMSQDGGQNWSEGINLTNTQTPSGAIAGACLSELYPTMCEDVDGECHILYVMDRDAGAVIQNEGTWTFNEVIYHSVSVDLIPSTPTVPQNVPFHVSQAFPPAEVPGGGRYDQPDKFAMGQNYPNPFNPTTNITFSLDHVSDVALTVYNLRGEEVAMVAKGTYGTGQHTATFDGSDLASGVYLYQLTANNQTLSGKMVLMK